MRHATQHRITRTLKDDREQSSGNRWPGSVNALGRSVQSNSGEVSRQLGCFRLSYLRSESLGLIKDRHPALVFIQGSEKGDDERWERRLQKKRAGKGATRARTMDC
uniref:Uncharacterized protein n=1 Tax=Physcomitrium patens TaxID=3218 RepID=A0A2K1JZT7_PHYPA|nr:hypothetical protein PHYPA_014161 [Physcomitrium patens]